MSNLLALPGTPVRVCGAFSPQALGNSATGSQNVGEQSVGRPCVLHRSRLLRLQGLEGP